MKDLAEFGSELKLMKHLFIIEQFISKQSYFSICFYILN